MQDEDAWSHRQAAKPRTEQYTLKRGRDPRDLTAKDLGPEV